MANIAFFDLKQWEKDYVKTLLPQHKLLFVDEHLTEKNVSKAADCDVLAVFIYSPITPAILKKLPKAKLITTMSTGFDHIDLGACKEREIVVCNVPAYGENTVAEHVFALLLAISKNLVTAIERTRRGNFSLDGLLGFDLKGKTLGLIGTGKIGSHVIKMAKGFDMHVIAFDPKPNTELAHLLGFEYAKNVDELLAKSDVITLHAPLTEQTKYLINSKNIGKIKKGAVLINTARGPLVQTEALLEALKKGIIKYAGLDVLEEECFIKEERELLTEAFQKKCDLRTALAEHMLMGMDNVLITPHSAWYSKEALERIMQTTVENMQSFLKGAPTNKVGNNNDQGKTEKKKGKRT